MECRVLTRIQVMLTEDRVQGADTHIGDVD